MDLEKHKKKQLEEAEAKVRELENEKVRLESEVQTMRSRNAAVDVKDNEDLEEELEIVRGKLELEKLEAEQVAQEHSKLKNDIEEFQSRLAELKALNDRLNVENQHQLEAAKATNRELHEVRNMLEIEEAQRSALESYIMQLKNEVLAMVSNGGAGVEEESDDEDHEGRSSTTSINRNVLAKQASKSQSIDESNHSVEVSNTAVDHVIKEQEEEINNSANPTAALRPRFKRVDEDGKPKRTRLDMEMELLALKKKLEVAKQSKQRLSSLALDVEAEKAKISNSSLNTTSKDSVEAGEDPTPLATEYKVPDWIRQLNVHAQNSKTLRVKIGKSAKENPDVLSFRYSIFISNIVP